MVWRAISAKGKSKLAAYTYTLSEHLLPFTDYHYGVDYVFQQDNASIHTSSLIKSWFEEYNIDVMPWLSKSSDLNPIENMRGYLRGRFTYKGANLLRETISSRQFFNRRKKLKMK